MTRIVASLVVALCAGGCAYRVHLASEPPGAAVTLPEGVRVLVPRRLGTDRVTRLPVTLRIGWLPFERHHVIVSAPGHRSTTVRLGRHWARAVDWSGPILRAPDAPRPAADVSITVVLVPEHGAAGTWTADQLGLE